MSDSFGADGDFGDDCFGAGGDFGDDCFGAGGDFGDDCFGCLFFLLRDVFRILNPLRTEL